jgi:A/G-specific adenine glycosylase
MCPVRTGCFAFINNATTNLPVKLNKLKIRARYFNYFLITDGDTILMNRRGEGDIWANMYDLPMVETSSLITPHELIGLQEVRKLFGESIVIAESFPVKKHVLTHQHLYIQFIKLQAPAPPVELEKKWLYVNMENLEKLALPKAIFIFIKYFFNL